MDSIYFAIAFCLTAVVMYDSAGVRRSAGKQAEVLNNIIKELFSEEHKLSGDKLKELLGHSPYEVLVGALYGAAVSVGLRYLIIAATV
jgi:acid phosphatase family membrane protein YuiD